MTSPPSSPLTRFLSISRSPFNSSRTKKTHYSHIRLFLTQEKRIRRLLKFQVRDKRGFDHGSFAELCSILSQRLQCGIFRLVSKDYILLLFQLLNRVLKWSRMRPEISEQEELDVVLQTGKIMRNVIVLPKIRSDMGSMDLLLLQWIKQMGNKCLDLSIKHEVLKFVQWSKWHVDHYQLWHQQHFALLVCLFNRLIVKQCESEMAQQFRITVLHDITKLLCLEIECHPELVSADEDVWEMITRAVRQLGHGHAGNSFGYHHCQRMRIYKRCMKKLREKLCMLDYVSLLAEDHVRYHGERASARDHSDSHVSSHLPHFIDDYCLAIVQLGMQSNCINQMVTGSDALLQQLFILSRSDAVLGERLLNTLQQVKKWRVLEHATTKIVTSIVAWPLMRAIWNDSCFSENEEHIINMGVSQLDNDIFPSQKKTQFKAVLGLKKCPQNIPMPSQKHEASYLQLNQSTSSTLTIDGATPPQSPISPRTPFKSPLTPTTPDSPLSHVSLLNDSQYHSFIAQKRDLEDEISREE